MDSNEKISYTLRLVYDDLKLRLSQMTQNVTSYDHMMYVENELRDESPFNTVSQHYSKILSIQDKIRDENRHIEAQIRTLHGERNSAEHDQSKKQWIANVLRELKNDFEKNLSQLRVMQQNFIQSHKSKIYDLERKIDDRSSPIGIEAQQKIALYRNCLNRCESDIHVNGQRSQQLSALIDAELREDEVEIDFRSVDIVAPQGNGQSNEIENRPQQQLQQRIQQQHQQQQQQQAAETYMRLTRQQQLLFVIICGLALAMLLTLILII